MPNRKPILLAVLLLCPAPNFLSAQSGPHTPAPGSAERQAICDAARDFLVRRYATGKLPQPVVFKIDHISVQGSYANLDATPRFKDGSYIQPDYVADIGYNFCLRKKGARWIVILDLSRSDVPSPAEIAQIRRRLPRDFPLALFSPDWRDLLGGKAPSDRF